MWVLLFSRKVSTKKKFSFCLLFLCIYFLQPHICNQAPDIFLAGFLFLCKSCHKTNYRFSCFFFLLICAKKYVHNLCAVVCHKLFVHKFRAVREQLHTISAVVYKHVFFAHFLRLHQ
uniref:Putative secreted protein n=1 Tax=Ixodes ricinus TaxID=34613 RepID=A0A147BDK3_IXORI